MAVGTLLPLRRRPGVALADGPPPWRLRDTRAVRGSDAVPEPAPRHQHLDHGRRDPARRAEGAPRPGPRSRGRRRGGDGVATELPTGNQERGFGSGGFDWSAGLVAEYRYQGWSFTAYGQHAFVHTPDPADRAGLEFQDVTSAGVGVEAALAEHTFLVAQVLLDTSTLRQLHVKSASDPQWTLWFGLRHHPGEQFAVEVGVGEDLTNELPPDITVWLAFVFDL